MPNCVRHGQLRAQVGMGLEGGQGHTDLWIPVRRYGCDQALTLASKVKESQRDQPSNWELRMGESSRRREIRLVRSIRNGNSGKDGQPT